MSQNGDSVEAKLAELDVKDSAAAGDREQGVSSSTESAGEQKVIAKFLMSNPAAGSIIGKGGANISELQSQSGARLQLSRANEFFPGTQDRVMLASGTVNQVLTALHLIWTKIQGEQVGLPRVCKPKTCISCYDEQQMIIFECKPELCCSLPYFGRRAGFHIGLNSKKVACHRELHACQEGFPIHAKELG